MLATGIVEGAVSTMQFLVFISLGVAGLIVLGAAVLLGHHDGDTSHDFGHTDHGMEHDTESAPSFLSPRVFCAFLTGFGAAGAIATCYGAHAGAATAIGFIPGIVMALIAWGVAVILFKQQANSSLRPGQSVGAIGRVVTTISAGGTGEVDVTVNGQIITYNATAEGDELIQSGVRVRVVTESGGMITVRKDGVVAK